MKQLLLLWWPRLELNDLEQRTFRRHLLAALLDGVYAGLISVTAYVLRKELHATALQIALLYSLQMSMFAFSSIGASIITTGNHRRVMLVAGLIGRFSYLWIMLWHTPASFITIAALVGLCHATYLPAQNMIFRTNYRRASRGVCYARAQIVALLGTSSSAWLVGRFLNWKASAFPLAFAAAGLCGLGAYLAYRSMPNPGIGAELHRARRLPYADFFEILRSEHEIAVKMLWQFLGVLADRLDQTSSELRHAKQELSASDITDDATVEIFPGIEGGEHAAPFGRR